MSGKSYRENTERRDDVAEDDGPAGADTSSDSCRDGCADDCPYSPGGADQSELECADLLHRPGGHRLGEGVILHSDEVPVDVDDARRLIDAQAPQWRALPLSPAGHGTDNQMFRLGDDLLIRLPRRPSTAEAVAKEQDWLRRLAPQLPLPIPEPVLRGEPDKSYPFDWSVLRWIEGSEPADDTVDDWSQFGVDLGAFVEALHGVELGDARRQGALEWYRGQRLADFVDDGFEVIEQVRRLAAQDAVAMDLDEVERTWRDVTSVPDPVVDEVLLHGDLRSANLVANQGKLAGVIDFGALSIGNPTAEHAAVWQLPGDARRAYRERLDVDEDTWHRARGWAMLISLLAMPYYWRSWPQFARSGIGTINTVLSEPG